MILSPFSWAPNTGEPSYRDAHYRYHLCPRESPPQVRRHVSQFGLGKVTFGLSNENADQFHCARFQRFVRI